MSTSFVRNRNFVRSTLKIALAVGIICSSASAAESLNDSQILGVYIQVNGFDIETALLGQSRASSEAVRKLAAQVSTDHIAVRQTAYKLAQDCKLIVELPAAREAASIEHGKVLMTLSGLSGRP